MILLFCLYLSLSSFLRAWNSFAGNSRIIINAYAVGPDRTSTPLTSRGATSTSCSLFHLRPLVDFKFSDFFVPSCFLFASSSSSASRSHPFLPFVTYIDAILTYFPSNADIVLFRYVRA